MNSEQLALENQRLRDKVVELGGDLDDLSKSAAPSVNADAIASEVRSELRKKHEAEKDELQKSLFAKYNDALVEAKNSMASEIASLKKALAVSEAKVAELQAALTESEAKLKALSEVTTAEKLP